MSVTPRGTGTAGLLSMKGVPLPESGAGASAEAGAGAREGPGDDDGASAGAGACAPCLSSPFPRLSSPRLRLHRSVGSLGLMPSSSAPVTGGGAASGDNPGEGSGTIKVSGTFSSAP